MPHVLSQTEKKLDKLLLETVAQNILILSSDARKKPYDGLKNKNCYYVSCIANHIHGAVFDLCQWPFREKSFDLIILDFHLYLAKELNHLFLEVSKKLTGKGQVIIVDSGRLGNKARRKKISITALMNGLNNHGFEKRQHHYIIESNSLWYNLLSLLCPWLCTTFIFYYVKKILPLTAIERRSQDRLFEKNTSYIPVSGYNSMNQKIGCDNEEY